MAEFVTVCEVGPRDGLQIAKAIMPTDIKHRWIAALAATGLSQIEVGSFVPPKLIPQMADTDAIVRQAVTLPQVGHGLEIVALAPNLRGAMAAYDAGAQRISIPISVSEGHSQSNTNRSTDDQIAEVGRMIAWLRAQPRHVFVDAACSTAFGCSFDGVIPVASVVRVAVGLAQAGADCVILADTVGYGNPLDIKAKIRAVRAEIGPILNGLHLHDTCGLGIANALAGLEEGIRKFDSALAGLGGCPFAPGASGNIVTEDLVFLLESTGFSTGIDLDKLIAARAVLHEGLPQEPMYGNLARAGVPKTFLKAA